MIQQNLPSTPLPGSFESMRVRSYGRIHFGLIEISESQPNCFGGIGLMIDHSHALLKATKGHSIIGSSTLHGCTTTANAHWLPRIESVANHWLQDRPRLPFRSIEMIASPLPHQGLGSGTQVACTVAALLIAADFHSELAVVPSSDSIGKLLVLEALAKLSQRGRRSNIGLRGFMEGGFIVDHGQPENEKSRTERVAFPDWPILIIQDLESTGDSGNDETTMFEQCSRIANPNREAMIQLVKQSILPAINMRDWSQFDSALGQYGRWAGQIFKPVQGGIYRSPQIAETIAMSARLGIRGATQSSWGPAVCAVAQDDEHAEWCRVQLQTMLPHARVEATRAANHSAQVQFS